MTEDGASEARAKRDWMPILIPVALSLVFQVGLALWFFGAMDARVSTLEERQRSLGGTSATIEDLKNRDAQRVIEKQELDIRLNRMDDKLDRLVELEMRRR